MLESYKYRGFSVTIKKNSDDRYTASLVKRNYSDDLVRSTNSELKESLREQIDSFYSEYDSLDGKQYDKPNAYILIVLAFIAAGLLLLILWCYPELSIIDGESVEKAASISSDNIEWLDKFSSFFNNFSAPLVSFLSFSALLWTIHQQNVSQRITLDELSLTRNELELTREELKNSSESQRSQAITLEEQLLLAKETAKEEQFNSTFYSLLEKHNEALSEVESSKKLKINARFGIESMFNSIHNSPVHCRYFRILYQLLKFTALEHNRENTLSHELFTSNVSKKEKFYSSLIRAMLTDEVVCLLAINCYSADRVDDPYFAYKKLVVRYEFLEHLSLPDVIYEFDEFGHSRDGLSMVIGYYPESAFGNNRYIKSVNDNVLRLKNTVSISNRESANMFTFATCDDSEIIDCLNESDVKYYMSDGSLPIIEHDIKEANDNIISTLTKTVYYWSHNETQYCKDNYIDKWLSLLIKKESHQRLVEMDCSNLTCNN